MKHDPGSNFYITNVLSDTDVDAGTAYTSSIDHLNTESASFLLTVLAQATTLTATVQHSSDDGDADAYTDEVAGAGNDVSDSLDADTGSIQLNVPNPRERYSRLKIVTTGDNAVLSCVAVNGPKLSVDPAATS
jgi:hypothetical protein